MKDYIAALGVVVLGVATLVVYAANAATSNLALGRPTTASSEYSTALRAPNATDGALATRWSSKYADAQWLRVDLGPATVVDSVKVRWEAAYASEYLIQVSNDGTAWSTVSHRKNGDGALDTFSFPQRTTRYIRMSGIKRATKWGYSIWEFEAYGPSAAPAACDWPNYPTPACTGVPAGTALTPVAGDLTASTPGQVIDRKHITGDLLVNADGVKITNSQIDGTVGNTFNGPTMRQFTISDSTIGPAPGQPCISQTALGPANYTATRVLIRGHGDGLGDSGDNIDVRDSFVLLCSNNPDDHSDGIQGYLGGRNVKVYHNTIDQRPAVPASQTAPIFISDNSQEVDAQRNLFAGGSETIRVYFPSTLPSPPAIIDIVRDNAVVTDSWIYGPVSSDCDPQYMSWSGNRLVQIDANYRVTAENGSLSCAG